MSCTCQKCMNACRYYPGWMLPEEAERAIAAGFGSSLMLDYFCPDSRLGNKEDILVLCPAMSSFESRIAPFISSGNCTFLENNLCKIHSSGFKPHQCVSSFACKNEGHDKLYYARLWDNPKAQELVEYWRNHHETSDDGSFANSTSSLAVENDSGKTFAEIIEREWERL